MMNEILTNFIQPFLEQLVKYINDEVSWPFILIGFILFTLIASFIAFIAYMQKTRHLNAEIKKINHEQKKVALDNLERLYKKRDEKLDADKNFINGMEEILQKISTKSGLTQSDINKVRNDFNDSSYKYFQTYMSYLETVYKGDKEKLQAFVKFDIKYLLQNIYKFQNLMNDELIHLINYDERYQIVDAEIYEYIVFSRKYIKPLNFRLKQEINEIIKSLGISDKV
jgi:hypothetical protein